MAKAEKRVAEKRVAEKRVAEKRVAEKRVAEKRVAEKRAAEAGRRKVADCRLFPSEKNCTLTISGREDEVLDIAVDHAVKTHGHERTPQLRDQIRGMLRNEA
jgi:predicted small metal-binding protein